MYKFADFARHSVFLNKFSLFRPHLWGGGTIYSNGFFCSVNFGRSIYSSQRNKSGIIKKLVQRRIQNSKDFFDIRYFSRSYRGLKFCVNTGHLITFSVIFLQIKIFSIKIVFET